MTADVAESGCLCGMRYSFGPSSSLLSSSVKLTFRVCPLCARPCAAGLAAMRREKDGGVGKNFACSCIGGVLGAAGGVGGVGGAEGSDDEDMVQMGSLLPVSIV